MKLVSCHHVKKRPRPPVRRHLSSLVGQLGRQLQLALATLMMMLIVMGSLEQESGCQPAADQQPADGQLVVDRCKRREDASNKRSAWLLFAAANSDANRLYEDLMMTYNRIVRPVQNNTDKVVVRLGLKLSQLIDVNLKNQMMTTNVWLNQEWSDYKLKWDPSEYGGIEDINLPAEQIWLPDIVLYNSAEGYFAVSIMTKAKVRYDGYVTWNPPAIFRSSCQIDITYFPFDSQNCNLKFGSWTFGNKIDLRHINDTDQAVEQGTDLSEYYQNVEWDIMKATAKRNIIIYTCCPDDSYPDVTFNFTLRRKPLFYTVNLILPCVGITILSFLVFYLPSDSGEKVTLTISILVSLIFFLSVLIETIPSTSLAMPLLGKYLVFTMILITVSVCATVCVLNIHFRTPSTHSMPDWVKRWCIHILPKYLLMNVPYYQNQQQGNILPEQLIYPHNQVYQQHSANWLTTNNYAAFEESTGANSGKVKSNEQSSDGSKRIEMNNIQTLDPRLLNQQFNTSQIMSSSSLFLPYLQSEAARRLKLQRSRSSERDQRSTSDCQGHPEQSSSSNNCDTIMMNHMVPTPTPLITTTNHDRLIKREKVAKDESQRDVNKESKKKKSFVSRLIGGSGATDDNESKKFGDEKQASQDSKNQQETSSSADNDYQYHNHFQARASICSTNLWRIGPTRRCSMAVVPNYPTFYRPLVQPNQTLTTQSGQINTISGCVVHNHDHNNIDSKGLNPQPGQTVGALVTSSAKNLPIRAKQQLLRPPESVMQPKFIAQDRSLGAQEVPLNVIRLAQLPQQQSNAFTIPDNYSQNAPHVNVSMPTPPPPLPPASHMDTMIRQNSDQFHEGTAHTSSQMFFQPRASHSLHSQGITSELGSGRRDLNNIANYNSIYMTSLPPLTNPVYGGLAYNQVRLNNQSRYVSSTNSNMTFLSTPLGDGVQQRANAQPQMQYQAPAGYYMSRSKSTDQRLHSYTKKRPNGNPTGCRKQSMNQFTLGHTSASHNGFGSNLLHEHHQTPKSIGRALGQAYLQKLQRQPTVCSTHSTDQARISRTMQRGRAFNVPLNVGQVEYRTSIDQVRRSRSQNSLSRRSFDQVDGNNCEECNSLYRSSSRNNRIAVDCPYSSMEDSCNCDIKSRRLNTYGYAQIDASLRCRMLKTDFCHGASRQDSAGESFQVKGLMRSCCAAGNDCDKISTLSRRPPPLTKLGLMKLVEEVDKAIQNAMFIAQHIDNLDEFESVKENWKFIAMVIDRIFLIVFFFACIAGTVTIFAMVPWSYYTHEKPIDLRLTAETALSRSCQDF